MIKVFRGSARLADMRAGGTPEFDPPTRSGVRGSRRYRERTGAAVEPHEEAPVTNPEPHVVQLDHEQGRALVDRRSRRTLGIGVDEFLAAYDDGRLDLNRRDVQDLALLIPFAR
jgi:hypothetical protein